MVRQSRTTFRTLVLAGCASLALCGAALAQDAKTIHFDIPAEDLGTALNQVAQQSQQEIAFNADLTRGKRAPALRGDFTPQQALDRLLAGSGLAARTTSDGSIVVEAGDKQSALTLEEVVVTAEKRREDVREISGSVSAFTGRQLETLGAQSLQDYLTMTPGVEFNGDIPGESRAVIRGVSTTTQTDQGQGTVGYFINDVPLTDPFGVVAIPDIDAFDVDNVAVLRGPQGTLFGSASLGGSINYQAAKPDLTQYQLHVQGTMEGVGGGGLGGSGKLMVNVPVVSDVFAIRGVYIYREDPGYIALSFPVPTLPAAVIAFLVAAVSGALMFLSDSEAYYHNTSFRIKVCLIGLAAVNMVVFHWVTCRDTSTWAARSSPPLKARWAGGVSCVIWTLVVFLGRWVGFTIQG